MSRASGGLRVEGAEVSVCWGFLRVRAPGRRSPAALFLVDNKADQRAWLCRSRSRRGSLRRPVIKASARCLCPAGQPTSITTAPVNRGRQPRPQCPARHRVLGKLSQEGPGPWLLSETQQGKQTHQPHSPQPQL